jgi:uncharacterized protein YbcI
MDISAEVARIHAAAYERDHRERVSTLLDQDLVMCVLRLQLTHAETLLLSHDHDNAVRDLRHAFELALAPTMTAAVERATGRTVSIFHTNTDLEPRLTLFIFILTHRRSYTTRAVAPAAARYQRLSHHRARALPLQTITGTALDEPTSTTYPRCSFEVRAIPRQNRHSPPARAETAALVGSARGATRHTADMAERGRAMRRGPAKVATGAR